MSFSTKDFHKVEIVGVKIEDHTDEVLVTLHVQKDKWDARGRSVTVWVDALEILKTAESAGLLDD